MILGFIVIGLFLFVYLIGVGFEQKFGKFDGAPEGKLDEIIYDALESESIDPVDLPDLREKLIELGFTHLTMKEIKKALLGMYTQDRKDIFEALKSESIDTKDLAVLRGKLMELGFTQLTMKEMKIHFVNINKQKKAWEDHYEKYKRKRNKRLGGSS